MNGEDDFMNSEIILLCEMQLYLLDLYGMKLKCEKNKFILKMYLNQHKAFHFIISQWSLIMAYLLIITIM